MGKPVGGGSPFPLPSNLNIPATDALFKIPWIRDLLRELKRTDPLKIGIQNQNSNSVDKISPKKEKPMRHRENIWTGIKKQPRRYFSHMKLARAMKKRHLYKQQKQRLLDQMFETNKQPKPSSDPFKRPVSPDLLGIQNGLEACSTLLECLRHDYVKVMEKYKANSSHQQLEKKIIPANYCIGTWRKVSLGDGNGDGKNGIVRIEKEVNGPYRMFLNFMNQGEILVQPQAVPFRFCFTTPTSIEWIEETNHYRFLFHEDFMVLRNVIRNEPGEQPQTTIYEKQG